MDEKLHQLNIAIEQNLNSSSAYLERANFFFESKEYQKCIEDCEQAIALDKTNAMAYACLGHAYYRLNKYDEALTASEKSLAIAPTPRAYLVRGNVYKNRKDYDRAITDYNKAIGLDENYVSAYYNRGIVYTDTKDYDRAIADYNKAIELDENYVVAYNNRGGVYVNKGDFDRALVDFNKAIELNETHVSAYNNRGGLYFNREDYGRALADFNKAIELDENYALAYYNRGIVYKTKKDYDRSLADYSKSKGLFLNQGDFSKVRTTEERIKEINGLLSESNRANQKIKELIDKIDAVRIEDSISKTKKSFIKFISEKEECTSTNISEFTVLRRWNSYTPIIADNYRISKGGGYFFKTPDCGIVIDPGFNFIDNFKASGYKFHEIDHILITHAHNDHTADLESILTLLHQYNEMILGDFDAPDDSTIMHDVFSEEKEEVTENDRDRIKDLAKKRFSKSPRRKRIRIYMTASTYKKYAPILDLDKKSAYDIILIKADEELHICHPNSPKADYAKGLKITAIHAKHNDLISDRDSIGFIIHYNDFVLVYTGDTGFSKEIEKQYKSVYKKYSKYEIILLAHLGGFKEYEKKFDASRDIDDNYQFFYKYHLGRLGLAKLVEIIKPKICIISEFGEEFRSTRLGLTQIFQEVYGKNTFFIPADIGLCLNTNNEIKLIDEIDEDESKVYYDFYEYSETAVCEHKMNTSLQYYKKGALTEADLREFLSHSPSRYC